MKRLLLLCCFLISTLLLAAQKYPDDVRKAKQLYDEAMSYFAKMPEKATQKDIDYINSKKTEMEWAGRSFRSMGNEAEQKLDLYFNTIIYFRMGYMYAALDSVRLTLLYDELAVYYLKGLLNKNTFPINFTLGKDDYSIKGSYLYTILPILYLDMAGAYSLVSKMEDAEKYSRLALSCDSITTSGKLRATGLLIACLEQKGQEDKELLKQVLSFWKTLRKADTAVQRRMKFTDAEILQKVKELTDTIYAKEDNWATPGLVARTLLELNKNEDAETFLKLVLRKNPNTMLSGFDDDFYYKAMMNAYRFRDKDVMRWAALGLAVSYYIPSTYAKDLVMVLNFVGDREYAKIVKKKYKR